MDTPFTDIFFSSAKGEDSQSSSDTSSGGLDWLNSALDSLGSTAVNVVDTKMKIDSIKNQTKTQQTYERANQTAVNTAIGSKNLINGIDNNILLVGGAVLIAFIMFKD